MHIQIVTFGLNGISDEEYRQGSAGETEAFASLPGLVAKIWLRDAGANIYGAVYLWRDLEAYEAYVGSDIFHAINTDATLKDITSRDYEVIEELTRATQPQLRVV